MDKDTLLKFSTSTCKFKLLHLNHLINSTSLFLELIKRHFAISLINCNQLDTLNCTELNKILQKYIDLLADIKSLFKANFSFENVNEVLKRVNEFTNYMAEFDKNQLQSCVQYIFKEEQKIQSNVTSFKDDNVEALDGRTNYPKNVENFNAQSSIEKYSSVILKSKTTNEFSYIKNEFVEETNRYNNSNSNHENFSSDDFDCLMEPNCRINSQNENKSEILFNNHNVIKSQYLKTLDKGFEISVEHVQSPTEFYILLDDINIELFEELQKKLKTIPVNLKVLNIKKTLSNKLSLSKKLDTYVLYYSICNEKWFRAKILDWCLQYDDDLVSIFILDTGETKCASICYLQNMPPDIKNYPIFLKQCYLSDVCPINNKANAMNFIWMNNAIEQMRIWIETSKKTTIKINSHHHSMFSASLPVTLWLFEEEKSVNQMLIENGLADKFTPKNNETNKMLETLNYKFNSSEMDNWNPMKEDYEAYNNIPELNILNPSTVIYGYCEKDSSRVCQQFTNKGKCYKGSACKQYHELLNPLGFTIEKEKVFINSIALFPKPYHNEEMKIEMTTILDVNKFCCTLKKSMSTFKFREETLSNLNAYINKTENILSMKKLLVPPAIGQIVITKCYDNNYWYRSQVLESEPENDRYTVLFVDRGNTETVPINRIRAIEPKYLHLPFQCVRCLIYGIENTAYVSSREKGIAYLENVIKKRDLIIKVVSILPGTFLSLLVHLLDNKKNDIAKELVDHNFAKYKKEIVLDDNSKLLPG